LKPIFLFRRARQGALEAEFLNDKIMKKKKVSGKRSSKKQTCNSIKTTKKGKPTRVLTLLTHLLKHFIVIVIEVIIELIIVKLVFG
jgi:hypothetical protein